MSVPAALDSKFSRLRLDKSASQDQKAHPLVPYEWIYGVRIKVRDWHRIAKEWNLPWEKETFSCKLSIAEWVIQETGVYYKLRPVAYKGKSAQIITFVVDEERRLDSNKFSQEQMEAVRKQFGINRSFRWFELYDRNGPEDDEDGDSSGDEEYPPIELPRRQGADNEDMEGAESDDESDSESESEEH